MMVLLHTIETFLGSEPVLFTVHSAALLLKAFLFITLIRKALYAKQINQPLFFLGGVIFASMLSNVAWLVVLSRPLFYPYLDYRVVIFSLRIAWGFCPLQYQSMAFLVESLTNRTTQFSLFQKFLLCISTVFCLFFILIAFVNFDCTSNSSRMPLEYTIETIIPLYCLFILLLPSLIMAWRHTRQKDLPLLLKQQIIVLIKWLLIPQMISDFIQTVPQMAFHKPGWLANSFSFTCLSVIFLTTALYFCAKKLIGLRFLTFKPQHNHNSSAKLTFIHDFKHILHRLSAVTTIEELSHITQAFFKDTLQIPFNKTKLFIRKIEIARQEVILPLNMEASNLVESFLERHQNILLNTLKESPVLIYDEIAFTNFYNATNSQTTILQLLDGLNADLFLPLFESQTLTGYIIIERYARGNIFYTNIERDEMIIFAAYLGAIMNIIKNKNLELLIEREQQLKNSLYEKIHEIDQFKESIRSFLRNNKHHQVGVVTYQNRQFTLANAVAKEMITPNLNVAKGHPITVALTRIASLVEEYKIPQQGSFIDEAGNTMVIHGMPHLNKGMVLLTLADPTISDIISRHALQLKDPSDWDYLLYLETTKSGRLINTLVPSHSPIFLHFKIQLLKTSLSTKAILIDAPVEDLDTIVQLLHHISMREALHTITLEKPITDSSMAIRLFGINPLLADGKTDQQSLLAQCGNESTVFIKNIHYLDLDSQEYLAHFIRYGVFRIYKSDHKIPSAARIVCSTDRDLYILVQEGLFSRTLYDELRYSTITVPSLITIPEDDLFTLVDGYSGQALKHDTFEEILILSERDKAKINQARPNSLEMLKLRVQQFMITKSKKHHLQEEEQFNPAYTITDPDLMQAKLLGKKALRDRKVMMVLWHKLKNQSDIAKFLNVDHAHQVWRRLREFNLE